MDGEHMLRLTHALDMPQASSVYQLRDTMSNLPPYGSHMTLPVVRARPDPLPRAGAERLLRATAPPCAVRTPRFIRENCRGERGDAERLLVRCQTRRPARTLDLR